MPKTIGSVINPYVSEEEHVAMRADMRQSGLNPDSVTGERSSINSGVTRGLVAGTVATSLAIGSAMLTKKGINGIKKFRKKDLKTANTNLKETKNGK